MNTPASTKVEQLLPCPFCGGEAALTGTNMYRAGQPKKLAVCRDCGACADADLWNTRATLTHAPSGEGREDLVLVPRAELRVRIQHALQATLGDVYDCKRVWSAWSYGTMGEDDFEPVLDRMDEIIDEVEMQVIAPHKDTSHDD